MKSATFLFLLFFCFAGQGRAQHIASVDELIVQAKQAKVDIEKVKLYLQIGTETFATAPQQSVDYFQMARNLSGQIDYTEGSFLAYRKRADLLFSNGYTDSALAIGYEAIKWARQHQDSVLIGRIMLDLSGNYAKLSNPEDALKLIEKCKDIFGRRGITSYDGPIYNCLQYIEIDRHQFQKSKVYGYLAIDGYKKIGDSSSLCLAYNNVGLAHIGTKQYDSAIYYLDKALSLGVKYKVSTVVITYYLNRAYIYLLQSDFDAMKPFAVQALAIARVEKRFEYQGLALYGLAAYYLAVKDYSSAQSYADSSLAMANITKSKSLKLKALTVLTNIAFAKADSKAGFSFLNQFQALNDSVFDEQVARNMLQIEKRFDSKRKDALIQLQKADLRQKTTLNYILIGGTLAILVISFLFYRNHKNNQQLQQQRINELETEKQLMATESIIRGEEKERARLAKDLHDGLGGMLAGIKFSLYNMKDNLILSADYTHSFEHSLTMLDSSIHELRRVAHNLMPEALLKFGLDTALRDFCSEMNASGILQVVYQSFDFDKKMVEQSLAVTIYRISQELLYNIVKHAKANRAIVQLAASNEHISLTIEDDGQGFDPATLSQSGGIGWKNIHSRVDYHKGQISLHSAAADGTSTVIEFPLV